MKADFAGLLSKARGQAYRGKGKRTGTPGNYKYTYALATARPRITEEQSPLVYNTTGTVHRLSIKDPAVPAYPHDQYHPQGLVSFIDYQLYDGGKRVYINYMSTHPDHYRQGHAKRLMDALYQKFSDKEEINWGQIHSDAAEAMIRQRWAKERAAPRDPDTGYQTLPPGPKTYGKL